jgi:hypothetical protein
MESLTAFQVEANFAALYTLLDAIVMACERLAELGDPDSARKLWQRAEDVPRMDTRPRAHHARGEGPHRR